MLSCQKAAICNISSFQHSPYYVVSGTKRIFKRVYPFWRPCCKFWIGTF